MLRITVSQRPLVLCSRIMEEKGCFYTGVTASKIAKEGNFTPICMLENKIA